MVTIMDAQIAVVMGAGGGIGSSICRVLGEAKIQVVGVDLDDARLNRCKDSMAKAFTPPILAKANITKREELQRVKDKIATLFDRIDILVNCQAALQNEMLRKLTDEGWNKTLSVHLEGTRNTMQMFGPMMIERKYGRIVNMSSIAVQGSIAGASYGAAKGAIEGLSRTAALEWAKYGITVNCVAPGLIKAGIFLTTPEIFQKAGIEMIPMKRAGEPEEVAYCVRFLCSAEAAYITGQTIYVCGGMSINHGI